MGAGRPPRRLRATRAPHRRRQQGHRPGRQGDRPGLRRRLAARPRPPCCASRRPSTAPWPHRPPQRSAPSPYAAGRSAWRCRSPPLRRRLRPGPPRERAGLRQALPARPRRAPAPAELHRPGPARHLRWSELPGGGVEPGEDAGERDRPRGARGDRRRASTRRWSGRCSGRSPPVFRWRGEDHVADHEGRLARLTGPPETVAQALTEGEVGTVLDAALVDLRGAGRPTRGLTFPRHLVGAAAAAARRRAGRRAVRRLGQSGWDA